MLVETQSSVFCAKLCFEGKPHVNQVRMYQFRLLNLILF